MRIETRTLRRMCEVTKEDQNRNEYIRGSQASKKIIGKQLKCYGHEMRRNKEHIVKIEMMTDKRGRRQKRGPKTKWKDVCKRDMTTVGLNTVEAINRATRRKVISSHTGDLKWNPEEKKK